MKAIEMPNLKSLGLAKKDVLAIAPEIMELGLVTAPVTPTLADITTLLERAYEEN